MIKNNKGDDIIYKAIEMREAGIEDAVIFAKFPMFRKYIAEIFELMDMLSKEGRNITISENVLRDVLKTRSKQSKTESILQQRTCDSAIRNNNNNNHINKGRELHAILTLIKNLMNKNIALGIGMIAVLLVLVVGATISFREKNTNNIPENDVAFEEEIVNELATLESDSKDFDELANDNSADEIGSSLSNVDKEVENASTFSASDLELYEKELDYELDFVSNDFDSTNGIENDNLLNSFSSDLAGI